MISKCDLRRQAIRIEREVPKEYVGWQDQIWAAYGASTASTISVIPFILPPARRAELSQSLMIFFTGFSRFATDFATTGSRI
jgi:D-glycero-alpha-D-manno-heptose-7-phosphate kinase